MCRQPVEFCLTGQRVPAGTYRDMLSGRELFLAEGGVVPAAADGAPSLYVRLCRRGRPPRARTAAHGGPYTDFRVEKETLPAPSQPRTGTLGG